MIDLEGGDKNQEMTRVGEEDAEESVAAILPEPKGEQSPVGNRHGLGGVDEIQEVQSKIDPGLEDSGIAFE